MFVLVGVCNVGRSRSFINRLVAPKTMDLCVTRTTLGSCLAQGLLYNNTGDSMVTQDHLRRAGLSGDLSVQNPFRLKLGTDAVHLANLMILARKALWHRMHT